MKESVPVKRYIVNTWTMNTAVEHMMKTFCLRELCGGLVDRSSKPTSLFPFSSQVFLRALFMNLSGYIPPLLFSAVTLVYQPLTETSLSFICMYKCSLTPNAFGYSEVLTMRQRWFHTCWYHPVLVSCVCSTQL